MCADDRRHCPLAAAVLLLVLAGADAIRQQSALRRQESEAGSAARRGEATQLEYDDSEANASELLDNAAPASHQEVAQQQAVEQQALQRQEQALKRASLASTHAEVTYASSRAASGTGAGAGQPGGVTRPKGWDQCLKFARNMKSQDVTGVELIRVWKSTCEPAVQAGHATERYRLMCNSLGGAVEPFASQLDYNVDQLCDSVLAVFHDVTAVDAKAR